MTGNLYWLDPALEEWLGLNERKRLCLCFLGYMALISWFVISIRHTSQCLTRYCLLGKVFNEMFADFKNTLFRRLDPPRRVLSCRGRLPPEPDPPSRHGVVHLLDVHHHRQRHHGLHGRVLHRLDAADRAEPQEDGGGLHRWGAGHLGHWAPPRDQSPGDDITHSGLGGNNPSRLGVLFGPSLSFCDA